MAGVRQRVFVVQRADPETGRPIGEPIAAKLTREAAQSVAKVEAPCKITALWADKIPETNSSPRAAEWETTDGYQGS